ncbi:Sulfate-transporting ATPase [Modestobacter italicus]|uniref:Sulfate-transporting ATPase n=1 Tax=Modestobacter italicus (strain DSM 44449 / CECT 9708 / BC 501) TaxID=2732864 RepID=I4F008_MODI5|nr:ATP-binding cassette domain-containing protein [Modestobacter marinus]CCH88971.1 Sulfate-transporting ATPase [Modestobacter marinus]
MSANPVIDVDELNVRYGDFHAVKDLSFQVEPGELYALLGTNGAGKTSALEVVEGHRTASSGTVRVFGQSPTDRRAVRPRTGIMLQESGFSGDLTVSESVRLIGRLTGRSDVVDDVLKTVDLTHKADTLVSQLSGARSDDSTSPRPSTDAPSWSSWTNPPRGWTSSPGTGSGTPCSSCARTGPRSC